MKLFLIRHGETVDNVAGIYAGVRDSALTNHGVLQAQRLGRHLADEATKSQMQISHIFSSDLQRAFRTAEAVRLAQEVDTGSDASSAGGRADGAKVLRLEKTHSLAILREQDFGYFEGKPFYERTPGSNKSGKETQLELLRNEPGFVDVESKESMKVRADDFIDAHLLDLLSQPSINTLASGYGQAIVIVSHGIFLAHLWRALLLRFSPRSVSFAPGVVNADRPVVLEHLGGWANTGYLEVDVLSTAQAERQAAVPVPDGQEASTPSSAEAVNGVDATSTAITPDPRSSTPPPITSSTTSSSSLRRLHNISLVVKAVNSVEHLKGLKKTRGGIGSAKHDEGQKTLDEFFRKKQRTE